MKIPHAEYSETWLTENTFAASDEQDTNCVNSVCCDAVVFFRSTIRNYKISSNETAVGM